MYDCPLHTQLCTGYNRSAASCLSCPALHASLLLRCRWKVHMDLETDLVPALHQLQQTDAMPKLPHILRHTEAESRHRRFMDAQRQAHRQRQANQAQQAVHEKTVQAAHAVQIHQQLTCCQSSTKPQRPRASMHHGQAAQQGRLRHEAEGLHHSSLDGKYWQENSSSITHAVSTQHETLIALGHRARNRAITRRLMHKREVL